jgi:hypothetical protein
MAWAVARRQGVSLLSPDGAAWIWQHVQVLFSQACQVLDYDHCAHYVHNIAKAHYGTSLQGLEWAEATMTRLYLGRGECCAGWALLRPGVRLVLLDEPFRGLDYQQRQALLVRARCLW